MSCQHSLAGTCSQSEEFHLTVCLAWSLRTCISSLPFGSLSPSLDAAFLPASSRKQCWRWSEHSAPKTPKKHSHLCWWSKSLACSRQKNAQRFQSSPSVSKETRVCAWQSRHTNCRQQMEIFAVLDSSQCDHIAQKPYQSRLEEICSKLAVTLCKATLFCRISRGKHETETCPLGIRLITCRNGLETVIDNKYPSHPAHYFLSHAWQSITIAIAIASAITITCYYISFLHNTSHDIHHIPCLTYHYIPLHGIPLHTILLYNTIA